MAEKKYLDLLGLQRYNEKIQAKIAADDAAALASAKEYTDQQIGTLDSAYTTVAAAIAGEAQRAAGVEGTLSSLTTDAKGNLVAAINEVDAHVDSEAQRAAGVEGTLTSLTTDVKTNLVAAINEVDAHADANATAIGKAKNGSVAGTGLTGRIEVLEAAVGEGGSVQSQIDATLDAVVGAHAVDAKGTVNARLAAIEADLADTVEAYQDLDVTDNVSDAVAGVAVKVDEVDGKVQKPVVTVADNAVTYTAKTSTNAAKLEVASTSNVLKGDAIAAVKSYVDAVAAGAKAAVEALDKDDTAVAHQFVTAVSETDGVITVSRAALTADDIPALTLAKITDAGTAAAADVATVAIGAEGEATDALVTSAQVKAYVDGLDGASDARLNALEATHATKTVGEGEAAHTEFMTVADEAAAAVAEVVAEAPEAFDTLKEIAEWIQKDGENGFDAAQRIQDLEGAVAKDTLVVGDGKTATVQNAIEKAVADEATRINGVVGTPDTGKTIQDEIDAVEAAIGTAKDGETAGTGLTGRIEVIEAELAGADTFAAITDNEIDALFTTAAKE